MYTKQLTQCLLFSKSSIWGIVTVTESKQKEKRMVWLPLMTNSPKVVPYVLAGCGRAADSSLCWLVKPGWSQPVSLMVYCPESPNASDWMVLAPILHHLVTTKEMPQLPLGSAWQVHGQDSFFFFSFLSQVLLLELSQQGTLQQVSPFRNISSIPELLGFSL